MANMKTPILTSPMQPSLLRQCPKCGRLFALRHLRTEQHEKMDEVKVYGCKSCGHETKYAAKLPRNTM
jgi:hypothetical protein